MTSKVIPNRIFEARESRAMSMEDLANKIGVTRQSISKYEKGIISPSPETLQSISNILNFPIDFFFKKDYTTTKNSSLFFRSNSNITLKVKNACTYQVKWANEVKKQLEQYVNFVEKKIVPIEKNYEDLTNEDIENLALDVRQKWGLDNNPIKDPIGVLENNGIIVSLFATNNYCQFKGIDAFSAWKDGTPYILYHSITKSAVRTQFSIFHELGHLIMHPSISENDAKKKAIIDLADMQADRFAAAFLLPATSFPKDVRSTSLKSLETIKLKWNVAMSTIIRRCETLELLSENQINYLKRQMTTHKYWHNEPLDDILTIMQPEMLRDAIYLVIDNKIISKDSFINDSSLPISDLKAICNLPDDFFTGYKRFRKPILKII